jgi:hypothetical protein
VWSFKIYYYCSCIPWAALWIWGGNSHRLRWSCCVNYSLMQTCTLHSAGLPISLPYTSNIHFPVSFSIADTSCSRVPIRALGQAMKQHYSLPSPDKLTGRWAVCQTGWSFIWELAEAAVRETGELQVWCHLVIEASRSVWTGPGRSMRTSGLGIKETQQPGRIVTP